MYIKSANQKRNSASNEFPKELEIAEVYSRDEQFSDGIDPDVLGYVHDLIRKITTFSPNSDARLESRDGALEVLNKILKLRDCKKNNLVKVATALKFLIESTPHLQTDPQ